MFSEYPDMMSIEEVRAALRIGRSTVYNLIHSGEIRYFKIGASIRVPKNCLLEHNAHLLLSPIEAQKYLDGIEWKREFHKQNNTKLIETYSYYNSEGVLLDNVSFKSFSTAAQFVSASSKNGLDAWHIMKN